MEMTCGDALVVLKGKTSTIENKLRALTIVFTGDPKSVYARLSKADLWDLSKYLYEQLLKGYEDVEVAVDNPCYHCYLGAVNKCWGCEFRSEEWAKDLEKPTFRRKVPFKNFVGRLLDCDVDK